MINVRLALIATGTLGLVALAACGAVPRTESRPRSAAQSCAGDSYIEVTNTLGTSVNVYARPSLGGTSQFLGTVSPGVDRLSGFKGMGFPYAEVNGRSVSGVTFRFGCER